MGRTSYMIFLSHGSTSRKLTGETNSSSTTLHLDTCSWKLIGEANPYGCPMANWKGHKTHNPNHMNESLLSEVDWGAHDSSVFLFLINIDYGAKPNESSIQGLWGERQHRTSSIPLIGLQTDSLATGQTGDDVFNSIPINPDVDDPEQLTGESIQSFGHLGSSTTMVSSSGETCHPCTSHYLAQAYGGIILISRPTFMDISISSKTTPHSSFHHLHTHTHMNYIYLYILLCMSAQEHVTSTTRGE